NNQAVLPAHSSAEQTVPKIFLWRLRVFLPDLPLVGRPGFFTSSAGRDGDVDVSRTLELASRTASMDRADRCKFGCSHPTFVAKDGGTQLPLPGLWIEPADSVTVFPQPGIGPFLLLFLGSRNRAACASYHSVHRRCPVCMA